MTAEKTVLIVEDDEKLNRLFCKHLNFTGFTVTGKCSITDAIDYLQTCCAPPAIVVLDLELSDGSGLKILEVLKQARFARTKVIIVSGHTFSHENIRHMEKVDYALLKPVSPRGLKALADSLV